MRLAFWLINLQSQGAVIRSASSVDVGATGQQFFILF